MIRSFAILAEESGPKIMADSSHGRMGWSVDVHGCDHQWSGAACHTLLPWTDGIGEWDTDYLRAKDGNLH